MEQDILQTQQLKKKKLPKWLVIVIVIPLVIIALHFHFYSALKEEFHTDQSVNPKATSYFLHATAIHTVWITVLHDFFFIDYDNLLLKPFLSLRDHFFEKGESIMPADNAEDAIWWIQNYASMYDFTVKGREDKSMAIDTLDKPTQRAIREKIYNYIIKMNEYGIKGIHSNRYAIPSDKMTDLVACYLHNGSSMFEGNSEQERVEAYYMDKNLNNKILNIFMAYDHFIDQYGIEEKDQYYFGFYKYRLLSEIIIRKIALTNDFKLHECDKYVNRFLQISDFIFQWIRTPMSDSDAPSRRIKHDFNDIAVSSNPDYVSNIITSNIREQCSQKIKTIQGVNNGN